MILNAEVTRRVFLPFLFLFGSTPFLVPLFAVLVELCISVEQLMEMGVARLKKKRMLTAHFYRGCHIAKVVRARRGDDIAEHVE